MSNLLNHPDVLKEARVELDSQIGEENLMHELDVPKLRYLSKHNIRDPSIVPSSPIASTSHVLR
jgi:isoflavone 2'-hydroxylase